MGSVFASLQEIRWMEWLQSLESPFLTALATFFSMLGEEYLLILVLGMCYWCFNKELGRRMTLSLCGSLLIGSCIKGIVLRRRPYMDNESVRCIRPVHADGDIMDPNAQGYSFPSLHSTMSVAIYGTFARHVKRAAMTALAVALPLLIGLSRIYLGVHYPTDVLCGWILGLALMLVTGYFEKKWGYRAAFLALLAVSILGFFFCRDNDFFAAYGITLGSLAGFMYEEKHVRFENAKHWKSCILRPVLGIVIFVVLNGALKLLIQAILPTDAALLSLILRVIRYVVSMFAVMGVYPHLFRYL